MALVGLHQQAGPWIKYTEPGTGFSISIPQGMQARKWYPGPIAGQIDPSLVIGMTFSDDGHCFVVTGDVLRTEQKRQEWQTRMTSRPSTEKVELKSGSAWMYAGRPNPNRSEFECSYYLLRHGWGWSIWGNCSEDQLGSLKEFLQRVAESFQWEPKNR